MTLQNPLRTKVISLFVFLIAVAAVGGGLTYPGSAGIYVFFTFAFSILLGLIFPRPRLYVYTFLALFFVLGFWMKAIVQSIWAVGFVEPVGGFDDTPVAWDAGLRVAAWAALGAAAPRLAHILNARIRGGAEAVLAGSAPSWFVRFRRLLWGGTILLIAVVNLANFHYAFFQVGVNPRLVLPAHLNVLLAWLINTGFALWLAALVFWEFRIDDRSLMRSLQVPVLEAFASSVSALSRQLLLIHLFPYIFAIAENRTRFRASIQRRTVMVAGWAFAIVAVLSLAAVFLLRILQYDELTSHAIQYSLGKYYQQTLMSEVPKLALHRWVGLEGVLSVNAAPDRGLSTFLAVVTEDPKRGADTRFQKVAKTYYLARDPKTNTFLSNAGITAILAFSGSLTVVFFGMALTMTLLVLTELYAQTLNGNPLFLAVA